jgi:TPR repeat protein
MKIEIDMAITSPMNSRFKDMEDIRKEMAYAQEVVIPNIWKQISKIEEQKNRFMMEWNCAINEQKKKDISEKKNIQIKEKTPVPTQSTQQQAQTNIQQTIQGDGSDRSWVGIFGKQQLSQNKLDKPFSETTQNELKRNSQSKSSLRQLQKQFQQDSKEKNAHLAIQKIQEAENSRLREKQKEDELNQEKINKYFKYGMYSKLEIIQAHQAAESGDTGAQFFLGGYYLVPEESGRDVNPQKGVVFLKKAANQGFAPAQQLLAQCLSEGIGVEKDVFQSVEWNKKAAEQGLAEAQYELAICYYNGVGVKRNESQALYWFAMAASQGLQEAKDALRQLS